MLAIEYNPQKIPRSEDFINKEIVKENFVRIEGTRYYRRIYNGDYVELVRYDESTQKWVFLLFDGIENAV